DAPARPPRRRGDLGRRSARAHERRRGGVDRRRAAVARQPPDRAARSLPPAAGGRASARLYPAVTPLVSLALATLAFVGLHFALSHPLRGPLVRAIGEGPFLGLYSAIALASLAWMIAAYRAGDDANPLWIAPTSLWPLASGVMLIACILLVGSLRGNPAFPRPGAREAAIGAPRGVFAIT